MIPVAQHKAITKHARRDILAFSKKLANHIGTIKNFIRHYNLTKTAALPV